MAIITFTSDFGTSDHYVAAVKARILALSPNAQLIDVTHAIDRFSVPHAAYVLNAVYRDFPKGTVHLVAVNTMDRHNHRFVAIKLEDHYFVGPDNGLMALLSTHKPSAIVDLQYTDRSVFPARDILSKAAVFLANEKNIHDLGQEIPELTRMVNREVRVTETSILGNVIHLDHYGNAVTNISQSIFERVHRDRPFRVKIGREHIPQISQSYAQQDEGDCVVVFNSLGYLEIAINKGNAAQLLGLRFDSPISILFS